MGQNSYDRVVIGGGLFGIYGALVLANQGFRVLVLEGSASIMSKASRVNQARLHTGLHYPRSISTARESVKYFEKFERDFGSAVRKFRQIYAISKWNSQTSVSHFERFIASLGSDVVQIRPSTYFNESTIDAAFEVNEPSFDFVALREALLVKASMCPGLDIRVNSQVERVSGKDGAYEIRGTFNSPITTKGIVFASYANINSCREMVGLNALPLQYELAQVILGDMPKNFSNLGFTVMDGPFWSMMPFGNTTRHSLTSVGLTPRESNKFEPRFSCQERRLDCTSDFLKECSSCIEKPSASAEHFVQQMALHLREARKFEYQESLFTVKTVLSTTEVDDARPTLILKEPGLNIWTIFSGKVSTLFDLEDGLK